MVAEERLEKKGLGRRSRRRVAEEKMRVEEAVENRLEKCAKAHRRSRIRTAGKTRILNKMATEKRLEEAAEKRPG
jgi:hypothetical protein